MRYIFAFAVAIGPNVAGAQCPENPDITMPLDQAYGALKSAQFPADAQTITQTLWGLWFQAPDDKAQQLLDQGMAHIRAGNLNLSEQILTSLVTYCPDYAEGYNQRAFARYLSQNFDAALPDLVRALELRPRHLGAISGKALTLKALGFDGLAQDELRKALTLNPWTPERDLIEDLETDI